MVAVVVCDTLSVVLLFPRVEEIKVDFATIVLITTSFLLLVSLALVGSGLRAERAFFSSEFHAGT